MLYSPARLRALEPALFPRRDEASLHPSSVIRRRALWLAGGTLHGRIVQTCGVRGSRINVSIFLSQRKQMTQTGESAGNGNAIRTDIPHPARVYDYWLGGKDNFAADREAAEWVLKVVPEMLDAARAGRQFLVRSVRYMSENGIRQFLDLGT